MDFIEKLQLHKKPCHDNYQALKRLYLAHSQNQHYARILGHKEYSIPNFNDLFYEAGKLVPGGPSVAIPVKKRKKAIATSPKKPVAHNSPKTVFFSEKAIAKIRNAANEKVPGVPSGKNARYLALETEKANLFREYVTLFHSLPLKASDEARHEPIARIKAIWAKIASIWDRINYFNTHGQWPPDEPAKTKQVSVLSVKELVEKARNLPTYISKYRKKLDQATTGSIRLKYEEMIAHATIELQDVTKKINAL